MASTGSATRCSGSTVGLFRCLCSLMPISMTLVTCSSALTLPTAAAAAAASSRTGKPASSSRATAVGSTSNGAAADAAARTAATAGVIRTRGGTGSVAESTVSQGSCDSGVHKHSFRSTGHPPVPEDLQLKQVVVICRHGDRAPVTNTLGTLLKNGPEAVALWNSKLPSAEELERWSKAFPPRVLGDNSGMTIEEIVSTEGPWGQLTTRGAEELRLMGKGLRGVLEGKGGSKQPLFPDGVASEPSSIFVRCTKVKRTHQSAQNLLEGLGLSSGVDLYVRPGDRETLWPSRNTRGRQNYLITLANESNSFPGQAELKRDTAEMLGLTEDEVKWTTVREVISCFEAHGLSLPVDAVESGMIRRVGEYTGWMWGKWFAGREMTRLSLGPFLAEMLTIVGARGSEPGVPEAGIPSTPKLAIFSGHDSTLVPILSALRIYDGVWPPYASYITLDIAENDTGERVVRIVYNGKEAVLPGAETPWIPLSELQKRLEDVMPVPEDFVESTESDASGSSEISAAVTSASPSSNAGNVEDNRSRGTTPE